jgi:carbamoyl-phosphate synthase large subunit
MTMSPVEFQKRLKTTAITLSFSDGTEFEAVTQLEQNDPRLESGIWGEAAFTTGMSGYLETMTDPSFLGQHIIFSSAHIGNYRSLKSEWQSQKTHATSLIARHFSPNEFLVDLLNTNEVALISGLDTRALVQYLVRTQSSHLMVIKKKGLKTPAQQFTSDKLHVNELKRVSRTEAEVITPGSNPIILMDYGVKQAIVDQLKAIKKPLVILPHNATAQEVNAYQPQMIFLSNGPGDPRAHQAEIQQVKEMLKLNIPVRGICLGHQLIGLALGISIIRLPFGQRGINHPLLDHTTGEILISSQNHGYAFDEASFELKQKQNELDRPLVVQYRSLFDQSIEGIASADHFLKSVQFHPEANPGPSDAAVFFREIELYLATREKKQNLPPINLEPKVAMVDIHQKMNKTLSYKRVLLIGSGPIKIGQASEFDYSGTQACKALKEIGVDVILLNSNPATIMTDSQMASRTYIEPITKDVIKKIIQKENVDAVLSTMGGQTALNICIELAEDGTLDECGVVLLGANVDTIKKLKTENSLLESSIN